MRRRARLGVLRDASDTAPMARKSAHSDENSRAHRRRSSGDESITPRRQLRGTAALVGLDGLSGIFESCASFLPRCPILTAFILLSSWAESSCGAGGVVPCHTSSARGWNVDHMNRIDRVVRRIDGMRWTYRTLVVLNVPIDVLTAQPLGFPALLEQCLCEDCRGDPRLSSAPQSRSEVSSGLPHATNMQRWPHSCLAIL